MSAVASTTTMSHAAAATAEAVAARTQQQIEDAEMYRWMRWFGLPVLLAAVFIGITFATSAAWVLSLAIATLIADILVLVWLCMSSDTNGLLGDAPSHH